MRREFRLPYREWRRLSRRAYAAQQRDQSEVCGLFAVDEQREIRLLFLCNESPNPGSFEIGWEQFRRARENLRAKNFRYLGKFHSHVISEAVPGPADLRHDSINALQLIYDCCGIKARLWRIIIRSGRKRALELPLVIERSLRREFNHRSGAE